MRVTVSNDTWVIGIYKIPLQSNRGRVFLPIYRKKQLIIIRMYIPCGRSNERHYGLDEVRMV